MSNLQLYLAIGIPMMTIIASLIISLVHMSGIRHQLNWLHQDMTGIRADMTTLTGKVVEIDNRLTRIEERLEHR